MILKVVELLNTILFRHLHIDQHKADTPMRILSFVFFVNTIQPITKHIGNISWGGRLKAKNTMRQSNFEKGQAIK
jgi:hypothetical protein